MSTFLVDKKNDLVLTGDTFQIESGLQGALLATKHYAQTLRGEMMHDMQGGVRFFETAYNQPRLNLFANDMRRRIMQVDGVRSVTKFDARLSQDELIYSVYIETIWGADEISNISVSSSGGVGSGTKRCEDATLFGLYLENDDLIFYSDNEAGTSPRMYIDDDGYLIVGSGANRCEDATLFGLYLENDDLIFYSDNEAGASPRMYIDDDGYLILESQ